MCGIMGYIGKQNAFGVLFEGLKSLEYRGYDSAGIALMRQKIDIIKSKGRIDELKKVTSGEQLATLGIGHTRWATHGEPSDVNAHPHLSQSGQFAVVHNGIIENYNDLKKQLIGRGVSFVSDTDTEVIPHLLERFYSGDLIEACIKTAAVLKGSFALAILMEGFNGIIALKKDSPLIVASVDGNSLIASDVSALIKYTRDFYDLQDNEIAVLSENAPPTFYDFDRQVVKKESFHVDWDILSVSLGGYSHFMEKEIYEQPKAVSDTINAYISEGEVDLGIDLVGIDRIVLTGCGSAAHTAFVGKQVIGDLAGINCQVELAGEFRYQKPILSRDTLLVVISQSGETADSLAALRYAKARGVKTLAIVNVLGSSIAKEADSVIYTKAGPEISVATTKAYSCQLAILYILAIHLGRQNGTIDDSENSYYISEIKKLPKHIEKILSDTAPIEDLASRLCNNRNLFFMGRNLDYNCAMEASLKLKEISYIHSEAYAAAELKHGTIALIEKGTPVIAIACVGALFDKLAANMREVLARGAFVVAVTYEGNSTCHDCANEVLFVPHICDRFSVSLSIIPLQLLAYFTARELGLDIDKPRNLAKSVTVE